MLNLSIAKRGFTTKFDLVEIVNAILYKLRNTIFHHYRKWSVKEEWEKVYIHLLTVEVNIFLNNFHKSN